MDQKSCENSMSKALVLCCWEEIRDFSERITICVPVPVAAWSELQAETVGSNPA